MKSLNQILKLAELFYSQAMLALGATPTTYVSPDTEEDDLEDGPQGDLLTQAENMWDQMDNPVLAGQFEQFIDSYRDYLNALHGPPPESDSDESFSDIKNTMDARWARLIQNPYLELEEDDPKYTEVVPPYKIVELIQNIVDDANAQKENKASEMGLDAEELDAAEKAAQQEMFQGQVAKDVINKMDDAQKQQYANKVRKKLDYTKKFREKLKTIRNVGISNLKKLREDLAQKIESTTNGEERKLLEQRLKNTPDPRHLEIAQEGRKRRHEKMMADPARSQHHRKELLKRYHTQHATDNERLQLIEAIEQAPDLNTKNQLKAKLVKLEMTRLERKGVNLDDEFVRNDPKIQKLLDPEEIIRRHSYRKLKKTKRKTLEGQRLRERILSGTFLGTIDALLEKIRNVKASAKKDVVTAIMKDIQKAKLTELKPILDKIDAAKKAGDKSTELAAIKELNAAMDKKAVNDQAELHPAIVKVAERCEAFRQIAYAFKALYEQAQKSENVEEPINQKVEELKQLMRDTHGVKYTNSLLEMSKNILQQLEQGAIK